jgi:hypothetical protein
VLAQRLAAMQVGDVDDRAAVQAQLGGRGLGQQERRARIDREQVVPLFGGGLAQRRWIEIGGVVDQRIEPAELGHALLDHVGQRLGIAQVSSQRQHAARARGFQLERQRLQFSGRGMCMHRHAVAVGMQVAGNGRADAARAAGDQGHG